MAAPAAAQAAPTSSASRTFGVALAVIGLLLAVTVGASWQSNVFSQTTTKGLKFDLQVLVPQGWAFFTRSPQEASLVPYKRVNERWVRADTLPQTNAENAFGFSRNQRAQGTELGILSSHVRAYTPCNSYLSQCLDSPADSTQKMTNDTNTQHFCGQIRLMQQEPVKFAYRERTPEPIRGKSYADLEISCPST